MSLVEKLTADMWYDGERWIHFPVDENTRRKIDSFDEFLDAIYSNQKLSKKNKIVYGYYYKKVTNFYEVIVHLVFMRSSKGKWYFVASGKKAVEWWLKNADKIEMDDETLEKYCRLLRKLLHYGYTFLAKLLSTNMHETVKKMEETVRKVEVERVARIL